MARSNPRARSSDIASSLAAPPWFRHGPPVPACAVLLSVLATASAFGQSSTVADSSSPAYVKPAESAPSPDKSDLLTCPYLTATGEARARPWSTRG